MEGFLLEQTYRMENFKPGLVALLQNETYNSWYCILSQYVCLCWAKRSYANIGIDLRLAILTCFADPLSCLLNFSASLTY